MLLGAGFVACHPAGAPTRMQPSTESSSTTIRQDEFVTILASPADRMITLRWTGYAPSAVYRSILEQAQENVRAMGLIRWLADLRMMDAILRQDEHWTVTDWFPRLAHSGLKRMAILTSSSYFNRMSVDRIMTASSPELPFATAYFDDPDKAKAWLLAS